MAPSPENTLGPSAVRILLLEDSDIDAELVESHLESSTFDFIIERASDRLEFEAGLASAPDLILSDYSLPNFDGMAALDMATSRHPDIPFIFVSGVVGEDFATAALQRGAVDYVTKRNLRRLRTAVARAVREARERQRQKIVEADLRASEVASRIALRAARLGGWDFDVENNDLTWDARCRAMFGIGADVAITYQLFFSTLHPDDRERLDRAVALSTTDPAYSEFNEQFRVITPDGHLVWIESIGSSIFEDGACKRFVGIVRDITNEKQAELALLDHTASLQASIEQQAMERHLLWRNSQDLLAVIGADGHIRDVTPSSDRLLGTPASEVIGKMLIEFVHEDDHRIAIDMLAKAKPHIPMQFEIRLGDTEHGYRWFSWTATPDDRGVIYGSGRDTTEEKDVADRLRTIEDALRQSQKMEAIGQLTGGVAHDFNNLLAGIIGAIDIVGRRIKQKRFDDLERFMDAASNSAHKAASLTQRLLAFSRRQSLDVQSEDVTGIINSMEDLLRRSLGETVKLVTRHGPGLWRAMTDSNQLESAILNLAINARDAMPNGGQLTIETGNVRHAQADAPIDGLRPGDYVRVSVSDNGEGMTDEVIAKAFDPFFTTKPIGQGTGLGLSMVYGFVNQSGGHVTIVSKLGQGTCIALYLERGHRDGVAKDEPSPGPDSASDGEVILVIEDDAAVRMLILEVLRELGYASLEAYDAPSALPHIQSGKRIDLILSDVGLPGLSGRELATLARELRPEIPILFVTGYAEGAEHRVGYLDHGMEMMTKPFRNDDLARRVQALLTG